MKIKLKTKAKATWSRMDREAVRAAAYFAAELYGLPSYGTVIIKLCVHAGEDGSAVNLDDETFMVFLTHQNIKEVLITLFHEMWHVRQYIYEDLSLEGTTSMFRKQEYDVDMGNCDFDTYWNLPWEVAAREAGDAMWEIYTNA